MDTLAGTPGRLAIGGLLTIAGGIVITSAIRGLVGSSLLIGGLILLTVAVGFRVRDPSRVES